MTVPDKLQPQTGRQGSGGEPPASFCSRLGDSLSALARGRRRRDLYRQGMAAFNKGDFDQAIAAFSPIADEDDNLHGRLARFYVALAHRHVGLGALDRGDYHVAIGHLNIACHYNPADGELARFLAVSLVRAGQAEAALAPLERAIAIDRGDARARIMLALAQWRTGQADLAELTLHQGLGLPTDQAAINFHLGLLAAQGAPERWEQVEEYLSRSVSADEDNAQAWRYLGLAYGAQGRCDLAAIHLRRAQRLAPSDPHIALELAYALAAAALPAAGPTTVNRLSLNDLTSANPGTAVGGLAGGPDEVEAGPDEDLDRLARAIIAEPEFIQAFLDLPASPMDQQIFGVLSFSLTRAAAARPGYADLHYYISRVNQRLGQIGPAIDSVEQAIAINPRYVAALIHAAGLYHQTAQRGTSASRLRQAIAAGGDFPDVHLLLGHLYRELGQVPQARRSYERALKLKPQYAAAKEALETTAA